MRSVVRVFNKIKRLNPYWSDYICFAESIKGREFNRPTITRHFNRLVSKEDYEIKDRKRIVDFLVRLSKKGAEEGVF